MNKSSSQQGSEQQFDVLIIGAGLAGIFYCLQLLKLQPRLKIAIISKASAGDGNSKYAQGGIAAVHDEHDSVEHHISDTLQAGDGLCYLPAVEFMVAQAPEMIRQLQSFGVNFKQNPDGAFHLAQEGGHSFRRIYNCGDQTGKSIIETLKARLLEHDNVHVFENHVAVNLINQYHPHRTDNQGEVLGAYILDSNSHKIHTFLAGCTVLATGGAGKTYRYTSNSMLATGDGVAMAYRSGARIGNMEFYQFHPTLLHHQSLNNFLISEAVRGEGAMLINPDNNERFMHRYAPDQMELATRDVVARAIFNEMEQSQANYVWLDISHQSKDFLSKRFPQIYHTLLSIGIDMSQDRIPVIPAAHYQCGGILTDIDGQTDLKRLYAIGETAFTGLHGANRLASNSLLEGLVMAFNAAHRSMKDIANPGKHHDKIAGWNSPATVNSRRASQINAHWRGLRGEMTSYAGIIRTEAGLEDLLQLILKRKRAIEGYYWHHAITQDFIELRNIVLNAELIVRSALSRRESRGGHYREDFPQKNEAARESILRQASPLSPYN